MAKTKLGALVGQLSGSIGTYTFSHNRFGTYSRLRSIPVQPNSALQLNRRATLAGLSALWATITAAQRTAWKVWAENNPIVDSLGDKRILSGHMAYVQLNARLAVVGGTASATPPITAAPGALTALTITCSAAAQTVACVFAPSPLAATEKLYLWGCKTPTATVNYVKNLLRFTQASAGAQATPFSCTDFPTIHGVLTEGEAVIVQAGIINTDNGLVSPPRQARCLVVA